MVEQARSFRGKDSSEPMPNWYPLILPLSEMTKYSKLIDRSYKPMTDVRFIYDESMLNTIREVYEGVTEREEITKSRYIATLTKIMHCPAFAGETVLLVGHGATVKHCTNALEKGLEAEERIKGEQITSCWAEFKPRPDCGDSLPWKAQSPEWQSGKGAKGIIDNEFDRGELLVASRKTSSKKRVSIEETPTSKCNLVDTTPLPLHVASPSSNPVLGDAQAVSLSVTPANDDSATQLTTPLQTSVAPVSLLRRQSRRLSVMSPEKKKRIWGVLRASLPVVAKERSMVIKKNAAYAKLCVLDAFQGRLSNGLANNSKKSWWIYTIFRIQTSNLLLKAVIWASALHSISLFLEPEDSCTYSSWLLKCFHIAVNLIYIFDITLKMSYEGLKVSYSESCSSYELLFNL